MGVDLLHGVLDQLGAVGSEELCIENASGSTRPPPDELTIASSTASLTFAFILALSSGESSLLTNPSLPSKSSFAMESPSWNRKPLSSLSKAVLNVA